MVVGNADERLRLGVANRRTVAPDQALRGEREHVGEAVGRDHEEQEPGPPVEQGDRESDRDPDEPERPDLREPDEDVVERAGPVMDDPALEMAIRA